MGKNIVYTGGLFEKAPCGSGGISCIDPKTKCIIYQIKGVYQKESIKDVKIFVDGYVQWECDNAKFSVSKDELGNPFVLIKFDTRSICKKKDIILDNKKYENLTIPQLIALKYTYIKKEKEWKESFFDFQENSISKIEGEKPDLPLPNILLSYGYKQQDIKNAKIPVTICEAGVYSCDDATFYFNNKAQYKKPHLTAPNGDVLTLHSTGWSGTRHFTNGSFVTRQEGGNINFCYKNGDTITIDNNDWYGTHTLSDGSSISKKKGDDKILMTYQNGDWYEGTVKESLLKDTNFVNVSVTYLTNLITSFSSLTALHLADGKGVVDGQEEEWINGETKEVRYKRHLNLIEKYDEDLVELIENGTMDESQAQVETANRKRHKEVLNTCDKDLIESVNKGTITDLQALEEMKLRKLAKALVGYQCDFRSVLKHEIYEGGQIRKCKYDYNAHVNYQGIKETISNEKLEQLLALDAINYFDLRHIETDVQKHIFYENDYKKNYLPRMLVEINYMLKDVYEDVYDDEYNSSNHCVNFDYDINEERFTFHGRKYKRKPSGNPMPIGNYFTLSLCQTISGSDEYKKSLEIAYPKSLISLKHDIYEGSECYEFECETGKVPANVAAKYNAYKAGLKLKYKYVIDGKKIVKVPLSLYLIDRNTGSVVCDLSNTFLAPNTKFKKYEVKIHKPVKSTNSKPVKSTRRYHDVGKMENCPVCLGSGKVWPSGAPVTTCMSCGGKGWYIEHYW